MSKQASILAEQRFCMTIAYDGSHYAGWQVQPDLPTIQGEIETALASICGQTVKVHGSGRTDQGVHARGQVVHVDLTTRLNAKALHLALNGRLAKDIRVLKVRTVTSDFHARRSACSKEYRYIIWNSPIMLPDRRLHAAHVYHKLDINAMRVGAAAFVGEHDFAAFTANAQRKVESTVRQITRFTISKRGYEITLSVHGNGFLYKQVRSMVGFLLRIGSGAESPEAVNVLLQEAQPRTARVPTAQPQGLFLWKVAYPLAFTGGSG